MALQPCRECGEQVSTWTTTCPKCGKQYPHASASTVLGGILGIAVLGWLIYNVADSHSAPNTATVTTAAQFNIQMPPDEVALLATVAVARQQYSAAANDMAKGAARPARARALCATSSGNVNDWVGRVSTLGSNGDGKGIIGVEISHGVELKTWNNDVSDAFDHTLIDPSSSVFAAASQLHVDQMVRFSGSFRNSPTDCFEEASVTLDGSITEPAFIFGFSAVAPIGSQLADSP
jgi:hypothetical protein